MSRGRPRNPNVLTPREWQVVRLMEDGLTNEEIATRLGISIHGARYHVAEILSKLGVKSRVEAVKMISTARHKSRLHALLAPFLSRSGWGGKATNVVALGSLAAVGVGLALLAVSHFGGEPSTDSNTHAETGSVGLDVSKDHEQGSAAFAALSEEVARSVRAAYPEAELKQIDVHGAGDWTEYRFVTTGATCEREFPPPDGPRLRELSADKCDVFVRVPRDAAPSQWQWTTRDAWRGDLGTAELDLTAVHVGPSQVLQAATAQWPGCTPRSATLGAAQGTPIWTAFCTQTDGGVFSGTADPETGQFRSILDVPVYPPPVASGP